MTSCCCLPSFRFNLRTPFSISFRVRPVVRDSFSFCFSGDILISLLLKYNLFLDTPFLDERFCCCYSALLVYHPTPSGLQGFCWEIHLQSYRHSLVCDKLLVFCVFQDSLFVFDFRQFDYVSQCGSFWVYPHWSFFYFLAPWICKSISFLKFGKFSITVSSNKLSAPFSLLYWDSHNSCVGPLDGAL